MGDRASISFRKNDQESVILFSHWGGKEFQQSAQDYINELRKEIENSSHKGMFPLDRLEPETVIVDFIRYLTKGENRVKSNYYLGRTEHDGDNSDNGHKVIEL